MGKLYSASVQIRDPKGNYLWIRRSPTARSRAGHYEHSGGRSEPGETAREAAVREIREETGIKIREDELRLVDRKTGPKGDHVTFSHAIRKAVIPKLSFEHDAYVWSPEKPALENGFFGKYMKGKDTSAMTTKQKAVGAAIGVGTTAVTRAAGKAIAKKMAAQAGARLAVKAGTASTGAGAVLTGGMMVVDAAPEAWAATKETLSAPGQIARKVWEAKGVGGKLKAAASGSGKAFLDLSAVPLRVGAAAVFGSGTVKMAREAAGEAMAARKAKQNGFGTSLVRVMGKAAGHAPSVTGHAGTLLREGGKLVGLAATTVIGGTVALKTAKAAWRDAKKNPQEAPNSQAFRRWFKGSKVVDEAGKPLVVYHGTKYDFAAFDKSLVGSFTNHPTATLGFMFSPAPEIAAQFSGRTRGMTYDEVSSAIESGKMQFSDAFNIIQTGEKRIAAPNHLWSGSGYYPVDAGANVVPVYLSIQKPLVLPWKDYYVSKADPEARLKVERNRQRAIQGGHDGIYVPPVPGAEGDEEGHGVWIAFEPTQIKSAVGNVGTFDPKDPNMVRNPKTRKPTSVDANMVEISKMLKSMPAGWRAQYEAGRNALADLGGPVLPRNPRPEQAANLIMLAAGAGHLDQRNDHPFGDIPVPEAVREAAMEGLRMSHKMSYGADHFIGIARAIQLAIADGVPASTLKRMKGYLSRHRSDKEGKHFNDEAQPSNGRMAWMNWGGDPGARWSSSPLSSKANPMSAYFRHNPYFVTRGGQAVPKAVGEERSTWQAAASHAERQEDEGTLYRIGQRDASGRWPILNRRTGQDTGKYGMTLEGAQEVLKRLIRRTNPAKYSFDLKPGLDEKGLRTFLVVDSVTGEVWKRDTRGRPLHGYTHEAAARNGHLYATEMAAGRPLPEKIEELVRRTNPAASTLVGDGYGVRMRDLVREGQGAELPKSTKAKKAQGAQARGKKAKAKSKRNPSPGFTTEEWLADVEGEEWANYDLNRAGIMHYSGSGIPTYRSLYRK